MLEKVEPVIEAAGALFMKVVLGPLQHRSLQVLSAPRAEPCTRSLDLRDHPYYSLESNTS